jgi:catalase
VTHRFGKIRRTVPAQGFHHFLAASKAAMAGVPEQFRRRQVAQFTKVEPAYGAGVAERMGLADEIPAE